MALLSEDIALSPAGRLLTLNPEPLPAEHSLPCSPQPWEAGGSMGSWSTWAGAAEGSLVGVPPSLPPRRPPDIWAPVTAGSPPAPACSSPSWEEPWILEKLWGHLPGLGGQSSERQRLGT